MRHRHFWTGVMLGGIAVVLGSSIGGCPPAAEETPPDETPPDQNEPARGNTMDKTNANARYITSAACRQCHADISQWQLVHGHAHKLTRIEGVPPQFPAESASRAGVPNPPTGFTWRDIAYVIGGYTKKARFINQDGFILTNGTTGVNTQWNLSFAPNGSTAGFGAYEPQVTTPKPYDASCFECHTTGPARQDEDFPEFEENRPGFKGTWAESGIQCEACHGPGSSHFATVEGQVTIDKTRIFVDPTGAATCRSCHHRPFNAPSDQILAAGGYIQHHEQWPELKASGGHRDLACTECHDPHRSVTYDRANAIRKECTACHAGTNMAGHAGRVFQRGDYSETLTCESCHMTYATKSATAATAAVVGTAGRMGDTRTHVFRIDTRAADYKTFFTDDGAQVRLDDQGRAAVTLDFVCLRCHNGIGAFELPLSAAAEIAPGLHRLR